MSGGIYLIQANDELVEMTEQIYDSEEQLQELLETYPRLLAGDQIDRITPRRWLLISREIGGVNEDETIDLWSLNHLFIDPEGIPTLVEVRQVNQPENRYKLIGQLLDYGANLLSYWSIDSILSSFERNCQELGCDPEQRFAEFLGMDTPENLFWSQVKTNLQAGKIRLIWVSDDIPKEMRRVIEFLNKQLDPAEVFGLEIKQYTSQEGGKTLVTRLLGQTTESQQKKSSLNRERRHWDELSFFTEFSARWGKDDALIAQSIHTWAQHHQPSLQIQWGTGDAYGGFTVIFTSKSSKQIYQLFTIDISGNLEISSEHYGSQTPFKRDKNWLELRNRFSSIGLSLPPLPTEKRSPMLLLSCLADQETLNQLLETFDWIIDQISDSVKK